MTFECRIRELRADQKKYITITLPSTFFQDETTWPMQDSADPRHGWPAEDVERTPCGPASADIYGKLYFYLRRILPSFLSGLRGLEMASFKLFQADVTSLSDLLEPDSFARIEVSNISDSGWLGIHRTLAYMMPLLQKRNVNPHATLITLFMNAVEETLTDEDKMRDMTPSSASSRRLMRYIPHKGSRVTRYDPVLVKLYMGRDLVTGYDFAFDRYAKTWLLFPVNGVSWKPF